VRLEIEKNNNMIEASQILKGYQTAEARWARFGPYYAMFPLHFAFDVIKEYSKEGDYIIDPFAGRCSSIFAGGVLGRVSLGIEINPVGWLYGKVKLQPALKDEVLKRLQDVYVQRNYIDRCLDTMPEFYRICFCDEVLKFLLAARDHLDWEKNNIDATLMAIILVYLHGKLGEGLSNQMRMTKSMGMSYSIKWWKENGLDTPPKIDPYEFLVRKIEWRFEKGLPNISVDSRVIFGDSTVRLADIAKESKENDIKFSLLFTSPPYCSITNYHADQWLRLWMLGGAENPQHFKEKHKGRFVNKKEYYDLLDAVFGLCSEIMEGDATVYVRTDARQFTIDTTLEVLKKHFPNHQVTIQKKPLRENARTQTKLFGDKSMKPGEVDIILTR
jgi:DNA modification methylase